MGKTQSNDLAERHGRETAGEQHGNGMVCVNPSLVSVTNIYSVLCVAVMYGAEGSEKRKLLKGF
jgi:hypothetical protein